MPKNLTEITLMIADSTVLFDCRRLQKAGGCVSPNITKSSLLSPNPPRFHTKTNHPLGSIQKVTVFETHHFIWGYTLKRRSKEVFLQIRKMKWCHASPVASSWTSLCVIPKYLWDCVGWICHSTSVNMGNSLLGCSKMKELLFQC